MENGIQESPWKVFFHGPMFSHERPQKGRWRQFTQTTIEVVNTPVIEYDVQFLKMLDTLFSEVFRLDNYVLKLNFLGCSDDRKNHKTALIQFLESVFDKICTTCQARKDKNTLRVFDCKNETCKALYVKAPKVTDHLCATCSEDWKTVAEHLQAVDQPEAD